MLKEIRFSEHIPGRIHLQDDILARIGMFHKFYLSCFDDMKPFRSVSFKKDVIIFLVLLFDEKAADFPQDRLFQR